MEGGAGFEPTVSRCASGVFPETPPARVAATVAAAIVPTRLGLFPFTVPLADMDVISRFLI